MKKSLIFYGGMLLVAAAFAAAANVPSLFTPPDSLAVGFASCAVATALALAVVLAGRALERVALYRDMAIWLRRLLRELCGGRPLDGWDALSLALASAVAEEALFRGFLQPWLARLAATRVLPHFPALDGPDVAPIAGIALASLLFGGLHAPVVRELRPWTAFAIVLGLAFGALAWWSGSLLAPIVAHFLINFLNLRRLAALPDPGPVPSDRGAAARSDR